VNIEADNRLVEKAKEAKALVAEAKQAIPNEKLRPTDAQIIYAKSIGIDPIGLKKKELREAIDHTLNYVGVARRPEYVQEHLAGLLPKNSGIDVSTLTAEEAWKHLRQRQMELQEAFPVGASVSFEDNGTTVFGVIAGYSNANKSGPVITFSLKGHRGGFAMRTLLKAERIHDYQDPSALEKQTLRERVRTLVDKYFREATFPIDIFVAAPKTATSVMKSFAKRTSVTDDEIILAIEKLRGKTY
jgi:hypothetical protein